MGGPYTVLAEQVDECNGQKRGLRVVKWDDIEGVSAQLLIDGTWVLLSVPGPGGGAMWILSAEILRLRQELAEATAMLNLLMPGGDNTAQER